MAGEKVARVAVAMCFVALALGPARAAASFVYVAPAGEERSFREALDALLPPDARAYLAAGPEPGPVTAQAGDPADWRARLEEIAWARALDCAIEAPAGREVVVRLWPRGTRQDAHRFEVVRRPQRWTAEPGDSLRETLARWGDAAGWQLVWSAGVDWVLEDPVALGGEWSWAVGTLLEAMTGASPAPAGELLRDGAVLIVRTRAAAETGTHAAGR